ncbi:MAG TPA: threonine synthase [Anaerolineales bacterium]
MQTYCTDCRSPLLARYDLRALRDRLLPGALQDRPRGLWRWAELLPVRDPAFRITLGEGDTPLLRAPRLGEQLGLSNLFIKDESLNPTGTFKARGLATAVARALELGVSQFVIPTAGNAGGALAAYAARACCEAHVFMPKDAPPVNQVEVRAMGADLRLVEGLINDAARQAALAASEAAAAGQHWFDVSTFKEPYRVEGKKTMGLELAEAFGWDLPDVILYPTGGGTGLVGMWKAFEELQALGWIGEKLPRLVSVQAEGCAPIVRAFENGAATAEPWQNAHTLAAGLRVPVAFADRLILRSLRESRGTALAVNDLEIVSAQRKLAHTEGIFAAPEGAATLAALQRLAASQWVHPEENIVLFITGGGLKYVS